MLNVNAKMRYDVTEVRLSTWMRGTARRLAPYHTTKHLAQDCLPRTITTTQTTRTTQTTQTTQTTGSSSVYCQPRPVWSVSESLRATQPLTEAAPERNTQSSSPAKKTKKDIKSKINSAGKKLVKTILHRHSPTRTQVLESDV